MGKNEDYFNQIYDRVLEPWLNMTFWRFVKVCALWFLTSAVLHNFSPRSLSIITSYLQGWCGGGGGWFVLKIITPKGLIMFAVTTTSQDYSK